MSDQKSRLREITSVLHRYKVMTRGITPEKLRLVLEDLGPTYVKLGQIMSLHSDILPKAYCDELMKLTSEARPMPFSEVESVISESYERRGYNYRDIFEKIDETPIGSASIAQVHRAVLNDGSDVIVKVRRRGIYTTMRRDIDLLHKAVRVLPKVPPLKNIVDLDMVLDELWEVAQEEMDFTKEAANMKEFAEKNRSIMYVTTPDLYEEYTTHHVLVMEYVDGWAINDAEALKENGYDLQEIGQKFANSFIKQVMDDGFFHADPHPGNVEIRDGRIVWLDMGMMGRLTEHDRKIMVRGVKSIALHDISKVTDAVLDLGDFWAKPDRDALYNDLRDFLQEYQSKGMGDIDLADAMQALMDIMKQNHMSMPHGMTMLARGLTQVEGVLAAISPDINMFEIAYRRLVEESLHDLDLHEEASHYTRKFLRMVSNGSEIPSLTSEIMKEYLRGKGRMTLDLNPDDKLTAVIDRAVRNLVIGLCITGLLVGSSIICSTDLNPKILGIPFLGFIGFFIAVAAIFYFTCRFFIRKWIRYRRENPPKRKRKKHEGAIFK
ncbi:MAG: AarF/ABC1/UbiB kinase family protein [Lachnospiraceae bacterium]|uniref:AarF/ABC1/UbiB kinase family protein n=1 Tax=Candidatus Weimeria bifida TaxID=2599074 RepID=A0A6N7IXF0_9FIRM|nr:AarF/ABC1/UbiB kinase family protein [Candidatus Weimeria bifida]RRF97148.1 MAG: AarF/ABC1/UbiB kinase family protein [Lachnospiraceae bacterium]